MRYRRAFIAGGCYFFTVVTEQRRAIFAEEEAIALLREAFQHVKDRYPFHIDAIVILPDHLHAVWTLPIDDADFSTRWRLIKSHFTKRVNPKWRAAPNRNRVNKQQQAIWQHRYWEHLIQNEDDYQRHIDYIHFNPVKHGFVDKPIDWCYSSFKKYVNEGVLEPDWGATEVLFEDGVGRE